MIQEEIYHFKSYLFSISYNLTGNIQVAEDMIQSTFEKWLSADRSEVINKKFYLSRIIINNTIDFLDKQKKERDLYKGLWLPEPLIQQENFEKESDVLDYAFLFIIEKLNPYERAVFVLREVFNYSYEEIEEIVNLKSDNCRQVLHRAKEKIKSPKKVLKEEKKLQKELLDAFLTAVHQDDIEKLKTILKEDIAFYSDGGGKAAAALKPLFGFSKVVKFLRGINKLQKDINFSVKEVTINGGPAIILLEGDNFNSFVFVEISKGAIQNIYSIRNPDKIKI